MFEKLVDVLVYQRDNRIDGSVYKSCQCDFAYNSNRIEGSTLSHDQTVRIFDRDSFSGTAPVDDIVEARNHFEAFDCILDTSSASLSAEYLCRLHGLLKAGTSDARLPEMAVGSFKRFPNVIGGAIAPTRTAPPEDVPTLVATLVACYEGAAEHDLSEIARFHRGLELIHPFSDGNGRVGRLIMFKECLRNGIAPFIVTEDLRDFYIRGLREYSQESGYLLDSLGFAQDRFEAVYEPLARDFWSAAMAPNCEKDLDPTRPEPTVADPYSVSAPASSLSLTKATDLR